MNLPDSSGRARAEDPAHPSFHQPSEQRGQGAQRESGRWTPDHYRDRGTLSAKTPWWNFRTTGPGIKPEIINRIFEPFFTTRQVGAGMGLGLSICHTIMEAHRGSIRAANRPEGRSHLHHQPPTRQGGAQIMLTKQTQCGILYIDDEEKALKYFKMAFSERVPAIRN